MKTLALAAIAVVLAGPVLADDHEVSDEVSDEAKATIAEMMTEMKCEVDPDDIEMTDEGGYDLDDVICQGQGQFDIELDAEFQEVNRRAE